MTGLVARLKIRPRAGLFEKNSVPLPAHRRLTLCIIGRHWAYALESLPIESAMNYLLRLFGLLAVLSSWAVQAETPELTPGSSWMTEAQRELAQREYQASANDVGLQAPNRAHGFRTYFDEQGIRLVARSADSEPLASIALIGYGRQPLASKQSGSKQDIQELGLAEVAAEAAEVTLSWPGISARYDNGPEGLQQTITLEQGPADSAPLSVVLAISDALPQINGDVVELRGASSTLQLGDITAQDAQGQALAVVFAAEGDRLLIAIDQQQAEYPITIKSVLTNTSEAVLESNQAYSHMGYSVAGAGDVNGDGYADVIVGAEQYDNGQAFEGVAFVYFGGAGAFDTSADGQLESNQAYAQMGNSVAGAGDVNGDGYADVIVGAYAYDNGQNNEGAAFVYFGGAGAFDTSPDGLLESNQLNAEMGTSVAGAGDVNGDGYADVIVGAQYYNNELDNEGAAFVYFGGAGAFNTSADGLLESNQAGAVMGTSVAGAGDDNGDRYAYDIVGA